MVKIIETNFQLHNNSFQSRVVEVESWEYIINLFKQDEVNKVDNFQDVYNNYYEGVIRPKFSKIKDLKIEDDRLTCKVVIYDGRESMKLIQLID